MSAWTAANLVIGGLLLRHLLLLNGIFRARRFLRMTPATVSGENPAPLTFFIIIPALREAAELADAVDHFQSVACGHAVQIVLVTTAREQAEAWRYSHAKDTRAIAVELARSGRAMHLHYPDPNGVKADQLNYAIAHCLTSLPFANEGDSAFMLVYDADSRPAFDTLSQFETAVARHPDADVFHQSSRFELRRGRKGRHHFAAARAIADAGSLRANRFVLAYELPRLLGSARGLRRVGLRSCVYAHVTGHGLCIRLSRLRSLPFPAGSPLEDMHYSFLLGSMALPMVPIPSLDRAEIPESVRVQFHQMTRWFAGPGRFLTYLRDGATVRGVRATLLASSAALISLEWLACAIALPLAGFAFWAGGPATRWLLLGLFATYGLQLWITESTMAPDRSEKGRMARLLAYPVAFALFGMAGIVGAVRLMRGGSAIGKTERV